MEVIPMDTMQTACRAAITRYSHTVLDWSDVDTDDPDTWWYIAEMASASLTEEQLTEWGDAHPDYVNNACREFTAATGSEIVEQIDRAGQGWIVAATGDVAAMLADGFPPPNPADALTFDECEMAGVDGTHRTL